VTTEHAISPSMAATLPTMPLDERIAGLVSRHGFTLVDADSAAAFAAAEGDSIILLTADPQAYPETWDVAVVLPEVLKSIPNRPRAAVADPANSLNIAARFGVKIYPALVFQRGSGFVGVLEGMQDWDAYLRLVPQLLARPVGRAPSIGIPVVTSGGSSSCH